MGMQSAVSNAIPPTNHVQPMETQGRAANTNVNEHSHQDANESEDEDEGVPFNPFDGMVDDEDSDEDIDIKQNNLDLNRNDNYNEQDGTNGFGDFEDYGDDFGDGEEMDFDADPFA